MCGQFMRSPGVLIQHLVDNPLPCVVYYRETNKAVACARRDMRWSVFGLQHKFGLQTKLLEIIRHCTYSDNLQPFSLLPSYVTNQEEQIHRKFEKELHKPGTHWTNAQKQSCTQGRARSNCTRLQPDRQNLVK